MVVRMRVRVESQLSPSSICVDNVNTHAKILARFIFDLCLRRRPRSGSVSRLASGRNPVRRCWFELRHHGLYRLREDHEQPCLRKSSHGAGRKLDRLEYVPNESRTRGDEHGVWRRSSPPGSRSELRGHLCGCEHSSYRDPFFRSDGRKRSRHVHRGTRVDPRRELRHGLWSDMDQDGEPKLYE